MHPSRPVRFGIIGAGNFTAAHVAEFRKLANVEVVAVCRRNAEALAAAQRQWGVPDGFSDHRDLLTLDGLDAVAIVTPTDSHRPIALDAIAAGKHVLREKPLALSAADAQEMLDAADAAGVVHATNFNQRGRTTAGQLQRYLADGFVGRIYHLNVWYGHSAQADVRPDYSAWRFRPESGGGTVYELCHVFDMARFLCGEVRRLCALLSTNEPHRAFPDVPEGMAISVPDSSAFLLEFAGGATGVAHTSWVARGLDAEGPNSMRVEVSGERGTIKTVGREGLRGVSGSQGRLAPIDPGRPYPPSLTSSSSRRSGAASRCGRRSKPAGKPHGWWTRRHRSAAAGRWASL